MINAEVETIIKLALDEDIKSGDITSQAVIGNEVTAEAEFLIKDDGIIAGLEVAKKVFELIDETLLFLSLKEDGEPVKKGEIAAEVKGRAASILTGERTALNFMQRMSGIATAANIYQQKINHTKAKIIDTRKTVPGLRLLDKYSVKAGGAANHRIGLFDLFLIKDNHIAVAGSIKKAVSACRDFNRINEKNFQIEVETTNLNQIEEALEAEADIIMLDNFSVELMHEAVKLINGKCKVEASGGITFDTIKEIAETGVDFISVGALTHSVTALDISLDIKINSPDV
jgi:nicotinate-nucleotide pyrophosphorylase (carboxylating)